MWTCEGCGKKMAKVVDIYGSFDTRPNATHNATIVTSTLRFVCSAPCMSNATSSYLKNGYVVGTINILTPSRRSDTPDPLEPVDHNDDPFEE